MIQLGGCIGVLGVQGVQFGRMRFSLGAQEGIQLYGLRVMRTR
jgi:hypothetical protein